MSDKQKREQKSVWVPRDWQNWGKKLFSEFPEELAKLGVKTESELYWRSAGFGRDELEDLLNQLRKRKRQKSST